MEGSETGGAWVGLGLGREDGGERDGRQVGGNGAGEGRWRGARREARGWGRKDGGERDGSWRGSQASLQAALGQRKSRTKHGGGSAAPCFAEACGEVNGAVLRG